MVGLPSLHTCFVVVLLSPFTLLFSPVGKNEQSKILQRVEQLNEQYDSRLMPATSDSFAPIFMQQAATGEHAVKLLMKKYGLTGTKATGRAAPLIAKHKVDKESSTTWVFATISGSSPEANVDACEGNEYFNAGILLNSCITTSDTSLILTCSDGEISAYSYSDNSCAGSPVSSSIVANEGITQSYT